MTIRYAGPEKGSGKIHCGLNVGDDKGYDVGAISRMCESDMRKVNKHLKNIVRIVEKNPFVGDAVTGRLDKVTERVEKVQIAAMLKILDEGAAQHALGRSRRP